MAAKQQPLIQMRLLSVNEARFMMSSDKVPAEFDPDNMQVGFSNMVVPEETENNISIMFGVQYVFTGEPVLECIYKFTFNVLNLSEFIEETDGTLIIKDLMPHFLSVAVGTMRGIIVARTAGTGFSKYPLPMIDIEQLNKTLSAQAQ